MCVCTYVCMYVVRLRGYVCKHACMSVRACVHVYIYICMYVRTYVYAYMCICMYMCVCM
jgi:hypothetical protein